MRAADAAHGLVRLCQARRFRASPWTPDAARAYTQVAQVGLTTGPLGLRHGYMLPDGTRRGSSTGIGCSSIAPASAGSTWAQASRSLGPMEMHTAITPDQPLRARKMKSPCRGL